MSPVNPQIASSAISGGSGALQTLVGVGQMFAQRAENRRNRQWQEKMYQQQLSDSRADWQRDADFQRELIADEREYNNMSNQVKRAVEAGINPNTIAGGSFNNAGVSSVNAPSSRSADVPSLSGYSSPNMVPIQNGLNQLTTGLIQSSQLDISRNQLEIERQRADADIKLKMAQAITEASKAKGIDADTLAREIRNEFLRDRESAEIEKIKSDSQVNLERSRNLAQDSANKLFQHVNIMPLQAKEISQNINLAYQRAQTLIEELSYMKSVRPWRESSEYSKHLIDFYSSEQAKFLDSLKPLQRQLMELAKTRAEKELANMTWMQILSSLNTLIHGAGVAASFGRRGAPGPGPSGYVYDTSQGYWNISY